MLFSPKNKVDERLKKILDKKSYINDVSSIKYKNNPKIFKNIIVFLSFSLILLLFKKN